MSDNLPFFKIRGEGKTVFLLHGFMESSSMWEHLNLDDIPFKFVLIDLPGHGKSVLDDMAESPSIGYFAKKVEAVADTLELQSYDVVGHSMGGYVALSLKELDCRCGKIVLLNSHFWEDSPQKKRDRIRIADLAFRAKDLLIREAIPGLFYRFSSSNEYVKNLIHEALKMSSEAIAYASLAMRERIDCTQLVAKYATDFLVIQGENDPLISQEFMSARLANSAVSYQIIKNTGHMGHIESSSEVTNELMKYLS
jgi:pimeloyl-ACP methyl ester carboxylesterase